MSLRGPLIVGGVAGSGAGALVRVLMQLRYFMAPRRSEVEEEALDVAGFDLRWAPPFVTGQADLERMRHEFDADVLPKLLPAGRWGWRHDPSAHLLAFYADRFPGLRFLHVLRDGREVAVSRDAAAHAARLGPAILDGDPTPADPAQTTGEVAPERVAAFWARANREIADFAERSVGDGYLRVRVEDLREDPEASVRTLARFAGVDDWPPGTAELLAHAPTADRLHEEHAGVAAESMHTELERFGYAP